MDDSYTRPLNLPYTETQRSRQAVDVYDALANLALPLTQLPRSPQQRALQQVLQQLSYRTLPTHLPLALRPFHLKVDFNKIICLPAIEFERSPLERSLSPDTSTLPLKPTVLIPDAYITTSPRPIVIIVSLRPYAQRARTLRRLLEAYDYATLFIDPESIDDDASSLDSISSLQQIIESTLTKLSQPHYHVQSRSTSTFISPPSKLRQYLYTFVTLMLLVILFATFSMIIATLLTAGIHAAFRP